MMAVAPCDSTTLILNDGRCPGESDLQRFWRQLWWRAAPWVLVCSAMLAVALPLSVYLPLRALPQLLSQVVRRRRETRLSTPLLDV